MGVRPMGRPGHLVERQLHRVQSLDVPDQWVNELVLQARHLMEQEPALEH